MPASQPPCYVRMKPASEASKPAWIDRAKCQPPKMQLRLFLLRFPFLQLLRFWYHSLPNNPCWRLHIYIHTRNRISQSLQGCMALPESSGVLYITHPLGSLHAHIHTYKDKGYIYMGGSSRRPFLTSAHSYVNMCVHNASSSALCGGSLEPHARASLPLCTPAPQVVCI